MASSSAFVSATKRRRVGYYLPLRKPEILQNIQVVPPAPVPRPYYDEEGRLPESLPPTPIIDLVTESETEHDERTPRPPRHGAEHSNTEPQTPESQVHRQLPSVEELNPEEIEREEDFVAPPALHTLRPRGGKNMEAILASVREVSPISSASRSPPASPMVSPEPNQDSPGSRQSSEEEGDGNVFLYVEAATRRLQKTKRRMERLGPNIRQRREASCTAITNIRQEIAALERRLEEEMAILQQCDAALLTIEKFENL